MRDSTTWAILAVTPALASLARWLAFDPRVSSVMRLRYHVRHWDGAGQAIATTLLLLALAVTLTFATAVIQNQSLPPGRRFIWVLLLLVASVLTVPLYWAVHLRPRGVDP